MAEHSHPTDQELLLVVEGEATATLVTSVHGHLEACWSCRARVRAIEDTIADFVRAHRDRVDPSVPPSEGPRALLKAQLAALAAGRPRRWWQMSFGWPEAATVACLACLCVAAVTMVSRGRIPAGLSAPKRDLTPGAVVVMNREQVCAVRSENNRIVPVALQRRVFEEYGIAGAQPQAYEVDYLITPALGGADDIHNLWPQPYRATVWNARVKDALEDRLRELVCDGTLDLATAQREIAEDWIAAYKRHFHTDRPRLSDQ